MATDFYTTTTRSMLSCVKEVGAMPFALFQYYLTWETASDGIRPSLKTVCGDLGIKPNALCNLRNILIKKGWIKYENDEVFILKSFRKNEQTFRKNESINENHSEKMNKRSEKMNDSFRKNEQTFRKNESPYKDENKQEITKENKQEKRECEDTTREAHSPFQKNKSFENCTAVNLFRKIYKTEPTATFAGQVCENVKDLSVWETLLAEKSGYSPERVEKFALTAYRERLTAKTSKPHQVGKFIPPEVEEFEEFETEIYEKFIDKKAEGYADWLKLIAEIKRELNDQVFASWFANLSFYGVDRVKQVFIVGGKEFQRNWIDKNYWSLIEVSVNRIGMEGWRFEWKK